jgi:hypothetical protein|tara:strand:- start:59 stop:352 length:294 start_codon:yes stop_codon:yes gene_type:complete
MPFSETEYQGLNQWERRLLNRKEESISSVVDLIKNDSSIPKAISKNLLDKLDGAGFTGDTLTTSSTPTVDELEACVGVLAGKVNLILDALRKMGIVK